MDNRNPKSQISELEADLKKANLFFTNMIKESNTTYRVSDAIFWNTFIEVLTKNADKKLYIRLSIILNNKIDTHPGEIISEEEAIKSYQIPELITLNPNKPTIGIKPLTLTGCKIKIPGSEIGLFDIPKRFPGVRLLDPLICVSITKLKEIVDITLVPKKK